MISERAVDAFTRAALSPDPDLAAAALMIARVEYPHLDARPYLEQLDVIGLEARRRLEHAAATARPVDTPDGVDPDRYAQVVALNGYLFNELRFAGNEIEYEDPRNSFLNEVLERRTGIPITLALLYIEIARRAGLSVEGVNFPGHFLLRCRGRAGLPYREDLIIDAFHGGALLSRELLARQDGGAQPLPHATKPQILTRMLMNLKRVYVRMQSLPQARDIMQLLLGLNPSAIGEMKDRGLLAYQLKDYAAALRDLSAYLELSATAPAGAGDPGEHGEIWEHVKSLRRRVATLN